jgi:DNA-binding response OmpR family regulator
MLCPMGGSVSRVLIADSDVVFRQALFSALLSLDVFSDTVGTTTEALAKLTQEPYGVLVIDVGLPFGDVENVIGCIVRMPASQRPVVLVLAANPEAARGLDVEIVQIVLRKPVLLSQLVDVVVSCSRSSRDRMVGDVPDEKPNGDRLMS